MNMTNNSSHRAVIFLLLELCGDLYYTTGTQLAIDYSVSTSKPSGVDEAPAIIRLKL